MTVTSDLLVVGDRAVVTCSSDSGVVERIEWQREGQVVVEATSVQQLELVLDPVSDTDHGVQISCVVTRSSGNMDTQNLTMSVTSKSAPPCHVTQLISISLCSSISSSPR